jgi:sugar phosphate isomerase/epimerase
MKLSVQLYSVREAAKNNFPQVLQSLAKMGYDGVEFAGLHGHTPDELRKVLDKAGIVASSAHGPVFDPSKWDEVKRDADALGYKHVVGGFGPDDFKTEEAVRATAAKVNRAVDHFAPMGLTVGYHNHWWEYDAPNKGDLLLSLCPKVFPQFDVYWVTVGGADPVEYIRRYAGRTKLVHIKDGPLDREKAMTAVGKGKVNVKGVVGASLESGVEWGIVELDRCDTDMLQAVEESAKFLKPLFTR